MLFNFHLPHYFANKIRSEVEHLYFSIGISNLAQAIVVIFEPIFLYNVVGLSIVEILLFAAAVYALYVLFIPFGAKIASRFGYAHAIFFSVPFTVLYWFTLYGSKDTFELLYFAPIILAIHKSLFWPAFHASLSRFANGSQVAREFSLAYSIMNFMQIIGPFIGGLLSLYYGIGYIFVIASIIYTFSAIPLFWSKEVFIPHMYKFKDTWEMYKTYPKKFIGYMGYGEELIVLLIWPIFIFTLIKNYEQIGLLVTAATFLATVFALFLGVFTDSHNKRLILRIGSFMTFLVWIARTAVVTPLGALTTDALSRTSKSLVTIPLTAITYERSESTHIMPYLVGYEQALALGKLLIAILAIIVFALTGSFAALFLLAGAFTLLYLLI